MQCSDDTGVINLCTNVFLTLFKLLEGTSDIFTCPSSYGPAHSLRRVAHYRMLIDQSRPAFTNLSAESICGNKMLTPRYLLQKDSVPICHLILFEHQKKKKKKERKEKTN